MSSREPWTIAMFRPCSMLYLGGGQRFCRFGPREWGAQHSRKRSLKKLEIGMDYMIIYEDGKRVFELWNQCGMFPNPKTKQGRRGTTRSCFDVIGNQICLRWSVKHCILQGMQQCLRKGLGVFAQNASNLVGDSVMTSVRCFGDVNAMQRLSLPRLHYIEFLMKQKKVTRARRALDRVCSLARAIGVFCVQWR